MNVTVVGELMGEHGAPGGTAKLVVRILTEGRPQDPACNSIILVRSDAAAVPSARYISWVGYADLDEASAAEPGAWTLIEPARPFGLALDWWPFGQADGRSTTISTEVTHAIS
jgi:hypothetical protein